MSRLLRNRRVRPLALEPLEGRAVLSGLASVGLAVLHNPSIKVDAGGEAAILSALRGGAGSEWATLARREVRNIGGVVAGFASGRSTTFAAPGLFFREPAPQPAFANTAYDQLLPTAAGAAVFKGNVIELAAILRGSFHDPAPSQYVFAIDRGAGAPVFPSRPGITPDALVTINVGPYGQSATGAIEDLTDGSTEPISPSQIVVRGATLRVFLDASQLPSEGAPLSGYKFAVWTQTQAGGGLSTVAEFAPDDSMVPIAVARNIAVRR